MSVVDSSLAGLTLDDVLGKAKRYEPPPSQNNTFLDNIREDDTSTKDKKSWEIFRDKLRLRRAGSAWTSSIPIPISDVIFQGSGTHSSRRNSLPDMNHIDNVGEHAPDGKTRSQLAHHDSVDATMPSSFNPKTGHRHSTGDDTWRALSAREAVASQEAVEAAAAEKASTNTKAEEPVTMSLMDLLGESGSSYTMGEDDDDYYDEDEEEEEEEEEIMQANEIEFRCCICKVNFTSSAFMPCGHVFCRLCSKELSVERGNCSLCNGFVLEILEIF